MISRTPGATSKATHGTAVAIASIGASGKPSPRELSTNTEAWRSAPATSWVRPMKVTLSAMPSWALCLRSACSSSPAPYRRRVHPRWRAASWAQASSSRSTPFSSCRRPMLATTFSVRGEGVSGKKGRGLGMKPTLSMRWRIQASASSRVSASIRSTSR